MSRGGAIYTFGGFELDGRSRQLRRGGERVALSDRYLSVLLHLAAHAGAVVSKDELVKAGWGDTAVGDNSLEQAISALRRTLGKSPDDREYVETVPRQGYRLTTAVTRAMPQATAADIDALLAPHRALLDGRAALETLERDQIRRGREVFTQMVALTPDAAPAHVGLANACVLQFEMTRADEHPDIAALKLAAQHAYEACRLDTEHAEGWSTLSFILERVGTHTDAIAAARRAIALEPDNWRHHFRLASIAWGEERLRAARRTLALLPGFALAHWLAASVLVARNMLDEAARDLDTGIGGGSHESRFSGVALHWLRGLIHLAKRDETTAMTHFERELEHESSGHLYARECCANTWYAIGTLHQRRGRAADAERAFDKALERVPKHALARFGRSGQIPENCSGLDRAFCTAVGLVRTGSYESAAQIIEQALAAAPPSNAGWLLPVEPFLNVHSAAAAWEPALTRLSKRAM
ncbi:MAG TPA: winged helix-turn-helix domain-containing protein [Vicinamibacterales bacterium]|nr:winged helix-turn-helix domain-containing protein [Vicinamibacterales bacterium]